MNWETVIGLEVHVQLGTRSKMFCGCSTTFGSPPNTSVCPVCLGLPGALPVPNEAAVRLGAHAALALGCTVHPQSVFARKNYFYPDLPKGYQITQYDRPLATDGWLDIQSPERGEVAIRVTRLHLEEDAGKLLHDRLPGKTAVDLNRAGVPLAEIVSAPDLRSAAEARVYLTTLKQLLIYTGASECSMEKGSLRVDANISLRPAGQDALGTRTEIKNLNSFANVERALDAEGLRQRGVLARGDVVEQISLTFHAESGQVRPMRSKEESRDYRYVPDPDLPVLRLAEGWVTGVRAELPELPAAKRTRLQSRYGLSPYDSGVLTGHRAVADYFEAVVAAGADSKAAANWVSGEALGGFNQAGTFTVSAARLAGIIAMVRGGALSHQAGRRVFAEVARTEEEPRAAAARLGLMQVQDAGTIDRWVEEVLAAHPGEVARYRSGESRLLGFLTGQVMKRSQGKADPKGVQPVLFAKLKGE